MAQTLIFLPWIRSGVYDLASASASAVARLSGSIPVQLETLDGSDSRLSNIPFEIMGPGDVSGLSQSAFRHTVPPRETLNAEANKYAQVELAQADIPWRFTPQKKRGAGDSILRPWITLVIGTPDEIEILEENKVQLSPALLQKHPLDQSAKYAHVQLDIAEEIDDPSALSQNELDQLIKNHKGRSISRLLSWHRLRATQNYIAVVVPTFSNDGNYSWSASDAAPVIVSNYHLWKFNTGEGGDFRTLAAKLRARQPEKNFGIAPLDYERIEPTISTVIRGALSPIGSSDDAIDDSVKQDLDNLTVLPRDPRGRPILTLPLYGEAWVEEPKQQFNWGTQINLDPRHRGIAGLGLAGGIHLQETITDAVKTQVGAINTTTQRVNQLVFGVHAASTLWQKRLPIDPMGRLMLLGVSLNRMATEEGKAIDKVAGNEHALPKSIFSSAAMRVMREGTARGRHSEGKIKNMAEILPILNQCSSPPDKDRSGLPSISSFALDTGEIDLEQGLSAGNAKPNAGILDKVESISDTLSDDELRQVINAYIEEIRRSFSFSFNPICLLLRLIFSFSDFIKNITSIDFCFLCKIFPPVCNTINSIRNRCLELKQFPYIVLVQILALLESPDFNKEKIINLIGNGGESEGDYDSIIELGGSILTRPDPVPCESINLDLVEEQVTSLVNPTTIDAWIKLRVLKTIEGYDNQELKPVEICTSVDLPTWRFLRDKEPNWLLPGVGQLKVDSVYAFESNPVFVDAFMAGINTQTLAELRWRNISIVSRCTPLRMFWGKTDIEQSTRVDDIRGIHSWADDTFLGAQSHIVSGDGTNLVLVMRSDIFRRYPNTLVSAIKAELDNDGLADFSESAEPDGSEPRAWPSFQGNVKEDVNFFGFPLTPDEARAYWIVIEETPPGYRFRSDLNSVSPIDGASFASSRFNDPTRVIIRGDKLVLEKE